VKRKHAGSGQHRGNTSSNCMARCRGNSCTLIRSQTDEPPALGDVVRDADVSPAVFAVVVLLKTSNANFDFSKIIVQHFRLQSAVCIIHAMINNR
jgi:hypothetical protein